MDHFQYKNGHLHAEEVSLRAIAEEVGTPVYVYSAATLSRHYQVFDEAFKAQGLDATVCYATKANANRGVLKTLAGLGAGADVVSEGELRLALAAGVPASKIVYSGVGKTPQELAFAIQSGIMQINVESEPELDAINAIALDLGKKAPVALRVNPDVSAGGHDKISTGRKEDKFGIEWTMARAVYDKAASLPGVEVVGAAVHIGSQITDLEPFEAAFVRLRDLVAMLKADGIVLKRLDLGGGLGVPYHKNDAAPPSPADYAAMVNRAVGDLGLPLVFEPGRAIAGNAGVLLTEVVYRKEGSTRSFAIVDAAMNDLARPAMYEAHHDILRVAEPQEAETWTPVDVVGPVCETGDVFARQRDLPPLKAGDLLVFETAGAYGASMSSTYNARPLVPEVLVKGAQWAVTRRRPNYEEMQALDSNPPWLEE